MAWNSTGASLACAFGKLDTFKPKNGQPGHCGAPASSPGSDFHLVALARPRRQTRGIQHTESS